MTPSESKQISRREFVADAARAAAAIAVAPAIVPATHVRDLDFDAVGFAGSRSGSARLTETMLLGVVALRAGQGRRLLYDGAAMKISNAPEADAYITRQYRAGWEL